MAKTYYFTNTAQAIPWLASIVENSMELTTGGATTASADIPKSTTETGIFGLATVSGEPNSAAWPSGTYGMQVDVNSIGADVSLAADGFFYRMNSTLTASEETLGLGAWDSTTGTGIKACSGSFTPASGSTGDRLAVEVRGGNASMMDTQSLVLNVNTSNTYATGPWTAGGTTYNKTGSGVLI